MSFLLDGEKTRFADPLGIIDLCLYTFMVYKPTEYSLWRYSPIVKLITVMNVSFNAINCLGLCVFLYNNKPKRNAVE